MTRAIPITVLLMALGCSTPTSRSGTKDAGGDGTTLFGVDDTVSGSDAADEDTGLPPADIITPESDASEPASDGSEGLDAGPTPPFLAPIPSLKDSIDLDVSFSGQVSSFDPDVAVGPGGRVAVVWSAELQTKEDAIFLAVSGPDANAFGAPVRVDTASADGRSEAVLCALAGGGWTVVYTALVKDGVPEKSLRMRRFDATGAPTDPADKPVPTGLTSSTLGPDVACDAAGGFTVTGAHATPDGSLDAFLVQLDAAAAPVAALVSPAQLSAGDQNEVVVALGPGAQKFVAWTDFGAGVSSLVLSRYLPADGSVPPPPMTLLGSDILPAASPTIAADPNSGAYAVAAASSDLSVALTWFATPTQEPYALDVPNFKQGRNHHPALTFLERSDAMALAFVVTGQAGESIQLFLVGPGIAQETTPLWVDPTDSSAPSLAYRSGLLVAAWTTVTGPGTRSFGVRRFGAFQTD